jgi:hypothetical protein
MRRFLLVAISLAAVLLASSAHGQRRDSGDSPRPTVMDARDRVFEPVHLPLSSKAASAWVMLKETLVDPPLDQRPLGEVLENLKAQTRAADPGAPALSFYIDPISLKETEITLATPVTSPFAGRGRVALHTYLKAALRQFGLVHEVDEGLVVIQTPSCCDCPNPVDYTAEEARAWLLLGQDQPLHFPTGAPLGDVLDEIRRVTRQTGRGGRGLNIHVNADRLKAVGLTLASPVSIDVGRVPLGTSLKVMLRQLGLRFEVRKDGVVEIPLNTGAPMDMTEVAAAYQIERYVRRIEETKATQNAGESGK